MRSMTGYGKGVATAEGLEMTVELKTVNNRFLEINGRTPKAFLAVDGFLRSMLQARISRGSVETYYAYRMVGSSNKQLTVDKGLALQFFQAGKDLMTEFGIANDLTAATVLRFPDVVREDDTEVSDETKKRLCEEAMTVAIDELISAREREGAILRRDLTSILNGIKQRVDAVAAKASQIAKNYECRLRTRFSEVLQEVPVDENKVLNEVAAFIDRADTNEEIQRLYGHVKSFEELIASELPSGRQMDFLTQELIRETNTLGSKCSDLATTNLVLELKNEIEKLKEQSRNVE